MEYIKQGDCMELMKGIPDKSIDLVLTDPPYNIGKAKWDKIKNYVEWFGKILKECERVLKDKGALYFFHNDMVQIAQIMEYIRQNTNFRYNSFIIWDKGNFRSLSWKNPSDKNKLRCWFNKCEYCLVYTFQDQSGLDQMLKNPCFYELQNYFSTERKKTGKTATSLDKIMGIKASYCYWEKPTTHPYHIPDEKNYKALQTYFKGEAFTREYESLRQEYESLRYTHNLDENHNNLWISKEPRNSGKLHPTQKPLDILERIIKTSSNEGDVILDMFMGSGSTGVACVNTHRNFIGIELDKKYFDIAKSRIRKRNEDDMNV